MVNNPSHVVFLHPSDNPNDIVVSDLMNGENYAHWKENHGSSIDCKEQVRVCIRRMH